MDATTATGEFSGFRKTPYTMVFDKRFKILGAEVCLALLRRPRGSRSRAAGRTVNWTTPLRRGSSEDAKGLLTRPIPMNGSRYPSFKFLARRFASVGRNS